MLSVLTVTNTDDSGYGSLRNAIERSRCNDTIKFSGSLSGQTITLTTGELLIKHDLKITGLGQYKLTISGNSESRIFRVCGSDTDVRITDLAIINGLADENDTGGGRGGAIYAVSDDLTLERVSFNNNSAYGAGTAPLASLVASTSLSSADAAGGAVYYAGYSNDELVVKSCYFSTNTASAGPGGRGLGGAIFSTNEIEVRCSTFTENQAIGGSEAAAAPVATLAANGLYAYGVGAGGAIFAKDELSVRDSTFTSNAAFGGADADADGGAIASLCKGTVIERCTFTGNQAVGGAGYIVKEAAAGSQILPAQDNNLADGGDANGGAVFLLGKEAKIRCSKFTSNLAVGGDGLIGGNAAGGAVYNLGDKAEITDTTFCKNEADGGNSNAIMDDAQLAAPVDGAYDGGNAKGGAVYNAGQCLKVGKSKFTENKAIGGNGYTGGDAAGGGIYNCGDKAEIVETTFCNNQAVGGASTIAVWTLSPTDGAEGGGDAKGGALYNTGCSLKLRKDTFTGNQALGGNGYIGGDAAGGAVYNCGNNAEIVETTFCNNQAIGGSLIENTDSIATSQVDGTSEGGGDAKGGALFNAGCSLKLRKDKFTGNQATGGDGLTGGDAAGGAAFNLGDKADVDDTTFCNNKAVGGNSIVDGTLALVASLTPSTSDGGTAKGGALFNAGQCFKEDDTVYTNNQAIGGNGGSGVGGDGLGGAVFNCGSFEDDDGKFTGNRAIGGAGATTGSGIGGGIYNASSKAIKLIHTCIFGKNSATTSNNDIFGPYCLKK